MTVTKNCHKCKGAVKVRRTDKDVFIWYCEACKCNAAADGSAIPMELIVGWQDAGRFPGNLDSIPLVALAINCSVCDSDENVTPQTLIPYQLREFVNNAPARKDERVVTFSDWPAIPLCQVCREQFFSIAFWYMPESEKKTGLSAQVKKKYMGTK